MLSVALAAALSAAACDHAPFDALLRAHVREGRVDYDAFARAREFPRYLAALEAVRPDALPAPERLAFWINAYNAWTIQLVNVHGERRSIKNVGGAAGPWKQPVVRAGGRVRTLDEVEHEVIRREFREPRIHFALVCAAVGCPPLRAEAYAGDRLEAQLDDQARTFILRSPGQNRVDAATRTVHASPIFRWYREDFGGTDAALGRFLAAYHPPGPARRLLESGNFRVVDTDYDWSLNGLSAGGGQPRGTRW